MKYCTKCGEKNPYEAKFCSKCGHPFVMEEYNMPQETKSSSVFPKYANVVFGILLAVYVVMAIVFASGCSCLYSEYKNHLANFWLDTARSIKIEYYALLTTTIGTIISSILLGCLWYNKKMITFYIYVVATVIVNIVAIVINYHYWAYLFSFGVLVVTIIFLFVKVKGRSVYELLQ